MKDLSIASENEKVKTLEKAAAVAILPLLIVFVLVVLGEVMAVIP